MKAIEIIKASIESHQAWIDYFDKYPNIEYTEIGKSVGDRAFHKERIKDYNEAVADIDGLIEKIKMAVSQKVG